MLNVLCSIIRLEQEICINHLWLTLGRLVATCIIYSFSLRRHRRGYFTISYLLVVAMVGAVLPVQTCKRWPAPASSDNTIQYWFHSVASEGQFLINLFRVSRYLLSYNSYPGIHAALDVLECLFCSTHNNCQDQRGIKE